MSVPINGALQQVFVLCTSTLHQVRKHLSGIPSWSGLFELSLPVILTMIIWIWTCMLPSESHRALKGRVILGKCVYSYTSLQMSTVSFQPTMTGYGHMELCLYLGVFSHDVFSFPVMWIGTVGIEGRRVNEDDDKDLTIVSSTISPGYMDYEKILLSALWTSGGTQMPVESLPIKFKCWSFSYSFL